MTPDGSFSLQFNFYQAYEMINRLSQFSQCQNELSAWIRTSVLVHFTVNLEIFLLLTVSQTENRDLLKCILKFGWGRLIIFKFPFQLPWLRKSLSVIGSCSCIKKGSCKMPTYPSVKMNFHLLSSSQEQNPSKSHHCLIIVENCVHNHLK